MDDVETFADDEARTSRLLTHLQTAYLARTQAAQDLVEPLYTGVPAEMLPMTQFEAVVLEGAASSLGDSYPPAGHTYPKRG